jgi:Uma2 family endonuclease
MARHIEDEVKYYYDSHSTKEDLMGETVVHAALVRYLVEVLSWLFHGQRCAIYENLNVYLTRNKEEYPLAPNVAVIKGVEPENLRSWSIPVQGKAPDVVFEIASEDTWSKDLQEKPRHYQRMQVAEYFAYDPNEPPVLRRQPQRLYGWRRDKETGVLEPIMPTASGAIWSEQLESWLVPDGTSLHLYDRPWQVRLTQTEAEIRKAETLSLLAEAERRQKEIERQRAEDERRQKEAERLRAEAEKRRADAEQSRAQTLAEKLRSLGIDPDQLV